MTNYFVSSNGSNQCYFQRSAERLVLEGYRHWTAGFETGSIQPWEMAWSIYQETLGEEDGRYAMAVLSSFVRTLKRCAACPLRSFPFHSHKLCTEEYLTMGLVSGIQHGNDVVELCLHHITCPAMFHEVEAAAHVFAKTLASFDQTLLPIPSHVIAEVVSQQSPNQYH